MTSKPVTVLWLALAVGGWSIAHGEAASHNHPERTSTHPATDGLHDGKAHDPSKAVCPVMGDPIDPKVSIQTDTGKVFFCCKSCIKDYQAAPARYSDKVFKQQEILGPPRVQVTCPVDGKPVSKSISLKHDGYTVLFSSDKCRETFKKTPAEFLPKFYSAFTTQTHCPITGEPIDPARFLELETAERIYFCGACEECPDEFAADPAFHGRSLQNFYLCPMARQDGDRGSLTPGDCLKCGMHRKQIGKAGKTGPHATTRSTPNAQGHTH